MQKSEIWDYEQEWRSVILFYEKPFPIKSKGVVEIALQAVKSVIFGLLMSDAEIKEKCRELKSDKSCAHTLLKKPFRMK